MSLSSLLLGKNKKKDADLDAIFSSSAGPALNPDTTSRKRKPEAISHEKEGKKSRKSGEERREKGKGKRPQREEVVEEVTEEFDPEADDGKDANLPDLNTGPDNEDNSSDEDDSSAIPVHESLLKSKTKEKGPKQSNAKKLKFVPDGETPEQRNARTIFIGNLPVDAAKSRPVLKQLKRHILYHVPTAKIESVRFRSVPFQNPTSKLEGEDEEDAPKSKGKTPAVADTSGPSTKQQRQQRRAATWREQGEGNDGSKGDKDEESLKADEKTYLSQKEKRRLAFIKGELHEHAADVHAYIVFAHAVPAEQRPSNLPPAPETMDPYAAARAAVKLCDGTVFAERTIRVDHVGDGQHAAHDGANEEEDADSSAQIRADPKLSVFVGNLEFLSTEEALRAFFEGLLCAERGDPPEKEGLNVDGSSRRKSWVTRARIVRDRDTQLGKGFAYVQFVDRECVDEILAMEQDKLKFAKRKLRVQRCKVLPSMRPALGKDASSSTAASSRTSGAQFSPHARSKEDGISRRPVGKTGAAPAAPITVPKGDPTLGKKLAGLSKDERKAAKATDADRVARRLAKKKARAALERAGAPEATGKPDLKLRMRKKAGGAGKGAAATRNTGRKEGKVRVRSERAVERKNMKKQ